MRRSHDIRSVVAGTEDGRGSKRGRAQGSRRAQPTTQNLSARSNSNRESNRADNGVPSPTNRATRIHDRQMEERREFGEERPPESPGLRSVGGPSAPLFLD